MLWPLVQGVDEGLEEKAKCSNTDDSKVLRSALVMVFEGFRVVLSEESISCKSCPHH